jgi:hypothetical protein
VIATQISCGPGLTCPSIYGYLTVAMAAVIFIGSVYVVLSAVFGIRMGYLVLATAFFSWMILWSMIWVVGAHLGIPGVTTPTNQGPRGTEAAWQPFQSGTTVSSQRYPTVSHYPDAPWRAPNESDASSVQEVQSAIQEFLAAEANQEHHINPEATNAIQTTDFVVKNIKFSTSEGTSLSMGQGFYVNGGPTITVALYHNSGSVPIYSWSFLIVSLLGFAIHVPFLDRAERKRKAVLTGGARPPWLGPA